MSGADLDAFAELWKGMRIRFDAYSKTKASTERMAAYFDDLKHLPIDDVTRAVAQWNRKGKKFPLPSDLLDQAFATRQVMTVGELPAFDSENPYYCHRCRDSGWQECWCPGHPQYPQLDPAPVHGRDVRPCTGSHMPSSNLKTGESEWLGHEYATRCLCSTTNPILRARRLAGAV